MAIEKTLSIEQWLLNEGRLTEKMVASITAYSKKKAVSVEQAIVELEFLDEPGLLVSKAKQLGLHVIDLSYFPIASDAATAIPEYLARDHNLIPVLLSDTEITVAMSDPLDLEAVEMIEHYCGRRVKTVLASVSAIKQSIERYFGVFGTIKTLTDSTELDWLMTPDGSAKSKRADINITDVEGPIAQIARLIITQAVNVGASDIHLEPMEDRYRVRMRIDGLLQESFFFEKKFQSALNSSAKIMSSMDIAETRSPQDGRLRVNVDDRSIDLRVSSYPTMHGEKIVLRILDKERINVSLDTMGFRESVRDDLKQVIFQPHGVVLVTGPTGSGKTTTLYSALREINTPHVNILTLEDPIEYNLDTINQGQVNLKAGMTFANGLRAMMRQDPDIVMIGEIRDGETAEIATQAALTGHLVLSTLHTNSAPGAVARLLDMGVEPFLVASALTGILAQRLVRRLCPKCRESFTPSGELLQTLGVDSDREMTLYRAVGCRECARTGYRGRAGIFEFLKVSEAISAMIIAKKSTDELAETAISEGMLSLRDDGIDKVKQGITSIEEVLRVTSRRG